MRILNPYPITTVMPDVRIPEREERRLPRQCNSQKKGSLLLTRARAPAATNAVLQGQRALGPKCYPNLQGVHKQLVAGLSGLVTCLQSNVIGLNLRGLFSNLDVRGLFQLSPDKFPFVCQAHVDWLAPGGLIIMLPRKTRPTPNLGCLSWSSLTLLNQNL